MRIVQVKYMPGTDLAGRIRACWHRSIDHLDMAMVAIPNHSEDNMWDLAHAVDDAEWELGIEVWINSYFRL